jgi:hypothetical protein
VWTAAASDGVVAAVPPARQRVGCEPDPLLEPGGQQVGEMGAVERAEVGQQRLGPGEPTGSAAGIVGGADRVARRCRPGTVGVGIEIRSVEALVETGAGGHVIGLWVVDDPGGEPEGHQVGRPAGRHGRQDGLDTGAEAVAERSPQIGEQLRLAVGDASHRCGPCGPVEDPGQRGDVVADAEVGPHERGGGGVEVEHAGGHLRGAGEWPGLDEGVGQVRALHQVGRRLGRAEELADVGPAVELLEAAAHRPGEQGRRGTSVRCR